LCFRRTRKAGILALAALALGGLCTNVVLKHLVGRERPWLSVAGLTHLIIENDPLSFPSGHTCAAFAAACIWAKALPKRWMGVAAILAAVMMGFSRLYLGVHFPSDVLAGMLVGILCAAAVWQVCKAWQGRGQSEQRN
ncbi:MAG: phosphatase PAP2 family protein, partial [Pseudoflavonifractor sp.]